MNFVKQTKFGSSGNCLEACIASLTEIPLKSFPNMRDVWGDAEKFWAKINHWLVENHGIYAQAVIPEQGKDHQLGLSIALFQSPSKNIEHAVLFDCKKERIVFDPEKNIFLSDSDKPTCYVLIAKHFDVPNSEVKDD